MPVAMFILHTFFGYPILSWCLKREGVRLLTAYRGNRYDQQLVSQVLASATDGKKMLPKIPAKYLSPPLILFKLILVGMLASWLSALSHGAVNQYILSLLLGVVFCEIGFLEEAALIKAGVFNWLMLGLLAFLFSNLSTTTPQALGQILYILVTLIVLGISGMLITSTIAGRFLGYSREMSFACALTALCGFPADYILTQEVCKTVSETEAEYSYLMDYILPKMLLSGFVTVSIASIIIASIFVNLL